MFLINKQKWNDEELTSTLIIHAKWLKMQIQIKVTFSILMTEHLMMVLHITKTDFA